MLFYILRGESDGGDHDQIEEPSAGALIIDVVDSAGQACRRFPESTLVDLRERTLRTYLVRSWCWSVVSSIYGSFFLV
jgi:hypothetical protein